VRIPPQPEVKAYREAANSVRCEGRWDYHAFDHVKDPGLWIETAKEIASVRPDVRFLLAGTGPQEEWIKQQIEAAGVARRTMMPGPALDIGLSYAALDVFLMTSRAEGLGNTLIEAQAAGRPVVSLNVGGAMEAILEGRTGLIVQNRSARCLASAVCSVLDDGAWRARAAHEGSRFVAQRFGHQRMVSETLQAYGLERRRIDQPLLDATKNA
jgi:glycosyltransferase involved in cell wall biosynthesis